MALDKSTLLARINALLPTLLSPNANAAVMTAGVQSALTLARVLYSRNSVQEGIVLDAVKMARADMLSDGDMRSAYSRHVLPVIQGTLVAMRGDVEAGLVGNVRLHGVGEALGDMLTLAREALSEGGNARNVAAVLAAAAFEDTIRKMGSAFAEVQDRPGLADVLTALKNAKIIEGASFTTAQGYLKFRNDALHADWAKLDGAVIGSCIEFVQRLLVQHFS